MERTGIFKGSDPFQIARAWLAEAERVEPNDPNAIALATVDEAGLPSSLATVDAGGVVTGAGAGKVVVRASVVGSAVAPQEARLTIYPRVTSGRKALRVSTGP